MTATLRDGRRVLLRPIEPGDKDRLREGLARLSPLSTYLRFHSGVHELTDAQLAYLTEVDHDRHDAWVALAADDLDGPGLGVARYVADATDPGVAEAAVVVADEHQGRGIGTLLLIALGQAARDHGVRLFRAHVLTENQGVLELLDQLGAQRGPSAGGVVEVDLILPDDPSDLPQTPIGRVFRAVAKSELASVADGDAVAGSERGELRAWLDAELADGTRAGPDDPAEA